MDPARLREEVLGYGFRYRTPFGERLMLYADYTASGRGIRFIERYLEEIQESYANTHTEDDVTGRSTTLMLHQAEEIIKRAVNGNQDTCVVAVGAGATGAIQKLQEILGVYAPPATLAFLENEDEESSSEPGSVVGRRFVESLGRRRPVVFVGPFEHHSNEVSWRESLAEVREIEMASDGSLDLQDLERQVSSPEYEGRLKIGSFSAASNVTGILTPAHDVARILHRHDALACFDYAASAPYVEIDMNLDEEAFFDAVCFSPHKFLGGPGSSGILLFHRRIYRTDLPPTFSGGGTVDYVGFTGQDYMSDIEAREKSGTPGTLQLLRAALAMELKEQVGQETIEAREQELIRLALERFSQNPNIEILGNPDPERRIGVVSFNLRHGDQYLHPKLATRLLNDLFGIQSRAGCSCAGPYGHRLLNIGEQISTRYRELIQRGCEGIKPGWVRVCFHYTMDQSDFDFICRAVEFLADEGPNFIPLYRFDMKSGAWTHLEEGETETSTFGLEAALQSRGACSSLDPATARKEYDRYLEEAAELARSLSSRASEASASLPGVDGELTYFRVLHYRDLSGGIR